MEAADCLREFLSWTNGCFKKELDRRWKTKKKLKTEWEIMFKLVIQRRQMEEILKPTASSHMEHSIQKHSKPAQEKTHSITASCYDIYGITWLYNDYSMSKSTLFWQIFPCILYLFICLIWKREKRWQEHEQRILVGFCYVIKLRWGDLDHKKLQF